MKRVSPPKPVRAPRKPYRQTERALATDLTRQRIVESTVALIRSARRVTDVTLQSIAEGADVTLRTVLRHYGTRDGIFEAAFAEIQRVIAANRKPSPPGDLDGALDSLLAHYEQDGDLMMKVLGEERDIPLLHDLLEVGRRYHFGWIDRTFGSLLPPLSKSERNSRLLELYAATDVYLWKLLRHDLGRSKIVTAAVMRRLVEGCLSQSKNGGPLT